MLKYEKFKEYEVNPESIGFEEMLGENYKFVFPNGYGASVIKHIGSYGYEHGLYELAVLIKVADDDYDFCYSTPITDNVLGYLTNDKVLEILEKIKNLKEVNLSDK